MVKSDCTREFHGIWLTGWFIVSSASPRILENRRKAKKDISGAVKLFCLAALFSIFAEGRIFFSFPV